MFCRNNSSSAGCIMSNRGICFDDVLLKPRYSNIESRSEIDLSVRLKNTGKNLSVPIVSSPMDTVTSDHMVLAMHNAGGLGVIHRYNDIETQVKLVESAAKSIPDSLIGAAIGVSGDYVERAQAVVQQVLDYFVLISPTAIMS